MGYGRPCDASHVHHLDVQVDTAGVLVGVGIESHRWPPLVVVIEPVDGSRCYQARNREEVIISFKPIESDRQTAARFGSLSRYASSAAVHWCR